LNSKILLSLTLFSTLLSAENVNLGSISIVSDESAINSDTILSARPTDIGTLLSNENAAISYNRKSGVANDVILRGFQKDNLAVLLDSQKIYGACPNRMDPPAFHVSSQSIASIDVQKGPFDVTQSGSLGGKIDVTTKEPEKGFSTNARIDYGSFNYYGASGDVRGGNDLVQYYLALSYQQSDAYKDGDGVRISEYELGSQMPSGLYKHSYKKEVQEDPAYKIGTMLAKVNITPTKDSTIRLHVAYDGAEGVMYPGLKMDADYDNTTRFGAEYEQENLGSFSDSIKLTYTHSDVDHLMSDSLRNSSMMAIDTNESYGMQTDAQSAFDTLTLTNSAYIGVVKLDMGLNASRRNWIAKNHINMGMTTFSNMIPDVDTDNLGLFVSAEHTFSNTYELLVGARYDMYTTKANQGVDFLASQRAGATDNVEESYPSGYIKGIVHVNSANEIYLGVGHSARIADPQEKYMQLQRPMTSPNWIGNPDLDAVKNTEFDLGYTLKDETLKLDVNLFYSLLQDYIYLYKYTDGTKNAMSYTNIDATMYGADISATLNMGSDFRTKVGAAFQRGEKTTRPEGSTNDNLAEIPPLKGLLSFIYEANSIYSELQIIGADSQSNIDEDLGEKEIGAYVVSNFKLGYKFNPSWQVFGELDNIFDTTYAVNNAYVRDPFSSGAIINEPGRSAYINLSYHY